MSRELNEDSEATTVAVRPARSVDLETLVRFNAALAGETEDQQLDEERLRRGVAALLADPARGIYRVAERDGAVVGALAITLEWSDWRCGWFWWIQSVYVDPAFRRQGVYRALHESVVAEARSTEDVCGVRLYVDDDNTRAQAVYSALGMRLSAYRMFELDFVLER